MTGPRPPDPFVAAASPTSSSPPQGAALRALLVEQCGWTPAEGNSTMVVRQRFYRVTTLARRDGHIAQLCEWMGHAELADYHARREVHGRLGRTGEAALTVFIDAASTAEVWSWTSTPGDGAGSYREELRQSDAPLPPVAFAPLTAVERRPARDDPQWQNGAESARSALMRRLRFSTPSRTRRSPAWSERSAQSRLLETIEGSRAPEVTRQVWREIEALRILDPTCGSGRWLLGCLDGLVEVGTSCLHRMRAWVEDQQRSPRRGPPGKLADFRSLLCRGDDLARAGHLERFVTETVLLRCLHAAEADAACGSTCRALLRARVAGFAASASGFDSADALTAEALVDVRIGTLAGGISSPEELAAMAAVRPAIAAAAGRIVAEADMLARAEELLVRMRLRESGPLEDLHEGKEVVRVRRQALTRLLADQCPRWSSPTLHPWIEYHGILRRGGFDLVRETPSPENAGGGSC